MGKQIIHISPKRSGHVWVGKMVRSWLPSCRYLDWEGKPPKEIKQIPPNSIILLQTRETLNWWASYLQYRKNVRKRPNTGIIKRYLDISKEWAGETNYLKEFEVYLVLYDDFFKSRKYREILCKCLGGEYNEMYLNEVPHNGGGSSFDGNDFDGNGKAMNVLYRKNSLTKKELKILFSVKGMAEFYERNFQNVD